MSKDKKWNKFLNQAKTCKDCNITYNNCLDEHKCPPQTEQFKKVFKSMPPSLWGLKNQFKLFFDAGYKAASN